VSRHLIGHRLGAAASLLWHFALAFALAFELALALCTWLLVRRASGISVA